MKKTLISLISSGLFAAVVCAAEAPAAAPAPEAQKPAVAAPAPAQQAPAPIEAKSGSALDKLSVAGTFGYTSEYVFRGLPQTDSALQAKVELGYPVANGNIYAGVWTNQPIANADQKDELDFYIGYIFPVTDTLKLDIGQTYYWFTEGDYSAPLFRGLNRSTETYIGINWDTSKVLNGINLNPSLYYYYDWNVDKHTIEASISYTYDLTQLLGVEGFAITPQIYIGYQTTCRPLGDTGLGANVFSRMDGLYYGADLTLTYKLNDFVGFYVGFSYAGRQDTWDSNCRNWNYASGNVGVTFGL